MINGEHLQRNIVAKITENDKNMIKTFIQGAVYCYCKNNFDKEFAARDLFGGANYDWTGTPLIVLYEWHRDNSNNDPVEMAGRDLGWLLLDVIISDNRTFTKIKGYTNHYKWIVE